MIWWWPINLRWGRRPWNASGHFTPSKKKSEDGDRSNDEKFGTCGAGRYSTRLSHGWRKHWASCRENRIRPLQFAMPWDSGKTDELTVTMVIWK